MRLHNKNYSFWKSNKLNRTKTILKNYKQIIITKIIINKNKKIIQLLLILVQNFKICQKMIIIKFKPLKPIEETDQKYK